MLLSLILIQLTLVFQVVVGKIKIVNPNSNSSWKANSTHTIEWEVEKVGHSWDKFGISLMTGPNLYEIYMGKIVENLDGKDNGQINWTLPEHIKPNSKIYFLEAYNQDDKHDKAWSHRFEITDEEGKSSKPLHSKQPTIEKAKTDEDVPWGIGSLNSNVEPDQNVLPVNHALPNSDEAKLLLEDNGGLKGDEVELTNNDNNDNNDKHENHSGFEKSTYNTSNLILVLIISIIFIMF